MPLRLQTDPPLGSPVASTVPQSLAVPATLRPRLDSIDFLRGVVMILMVLDHARDFLTGSGMNPRDVTDTALFLTRWVTHFCAPIFIFLSGVSAFLYGTRNRTTKEVAWFLLTRGLWLVAIELTLVRFAWTFNLTYDFVFLQVIWAIGCSMMLMAALVYLPRRVLATASVMVIVGHNLLDGVAASELGSLAWLWTLVHAPGSLQPAEHVQVLAIYPIVPWVAVMAAGYALGPVFLLEAARRQQILLRLGAVVTLGFVVLRASNLYGDPMPWSMQESAVATLLSFVNCEKYPPSLLYLAMTLGPCVLALALLPDIHGAVSRAVVAIGRVPFLFYVTHLFVVHSMALLVAWWGGFDVTWLFEDMPAFGKPAGFGLSLPGVYILWMVAILMLYPLCRWFGSVKQRRKDWWLSYL